MNAITQWLNGCRDFQEGVELYVQFGSSLAFKETLTDPRIDPTSRYLNENLVYELNKIKDKEFEFSKFDIHSKSDKNEIKSWLNSSRDFYKGVELYFKYGKSLYLKHNLVTCGKTKYYEETLVGELLRIYQSMEQPINNGIIKKKGRPRKIESSFSF